MTLDWAHTPQTNKQYYQTGSEVEPAREAQTGTTKEHLAQRNGGRHQENGTHMEPTGEESRGQRCLENTCWRPMPLWGAIGVSK